MKVRADMSKKNTVKQDMNFLEHPMWLLDHRSVGDDNRWVDRDNFVYYAAYKVPTQVDMLFLLSLLRKSQETGWATEIEVSRHAVLRECGKSTSKAAYERLSESLKRWEHVRLEFAGTFYDGLKYVTIHFGIIDEWRLTEGGTLSVRFSPTWLKHIRNSTFYKYIDLGSVKRFKSPLAMRLYEILLKNLQSRTQWSIGARKLAQKIPMKQEYVSHILPKLRTAVKQIREKTDLNVSMHVRKTGRGKAMVTFRRASSEGGVQLSLPGADFATPEQNEELAALLTLVKDSERENQEVWKKLLEALTSFEEERIRRNIVYANIKARENYPVYLMRSIEEDWSAHLRQFRVGKAKKSSKGDAKPVPADVIDVPSKESDPGKSFDFRYLAEVAVEQMSASAARRLRTKAGETEPVDFLCEQMQRWYQEDFHDFKSVLSRLYSDYRITLDIFEM